MGRIIVLVLPMPIYWALYHQQSSRWLLQATRLNGDLGAWDIKPDHTKIFNPLIVVILLPLFNYVLYPALAYIGIKTLLQKIVLGGFICASAYLLSGFLELELEV